MAQVNFRNRRGLRLEGTLEVEDPTRIVIMAHGFTGDRSEWGRFDTLSQRFRERGLSTLALDLSGSGTSADEPLLLANQVCDIADAVEYMKTAYAHIGLYGHSMGGTVVLRNHDQGIKAIACTAPVTDAVPDYGTTRFTPEQHAYAAEHGVFVRERDRGTRRRIEIDPRIITERETLDQQALLSPIAMPTLIVHGLEDRTVPPEQTMEAPRYLGSNSKIVLLDGLDHDNILTAPPSTELLVEWMDQYVR